MNSLLKKTDVAARLNVSIRTVDRLRRQGELKAGKVLGTVRFDPDDVREYLERALKVGR